MRFFLVRPAIFLCLIAILGAQQAQTRSEGYVSIFNGHDLAGWTGDRGRWTADGGVLWRISDGAPATLVFESRKLTDFDLRFEFRVMRGAGRIKVRGPAEGPVGVAFEIGSSVPRWLVNGSPALVATNVKAAEWNEYRLVCNDTSFHVLQNGVESAFGLVTRDGPTSGSLAIILPAGIASEIELRNIGLKY